MKDTDKHCIEIIESHWPKNINGSISYYMPHDHICEFMDGMRTAQAMLIKHYFPSMDNQTKMRAKRTLEILENKGI